MLLKCEDCMVTFESESLKDCPSCGIADFIYQLSDNQVLTYENQKLATALKDLVSAQEQLWTSINGRGLVDEAMDNAKQVLAEIGGEDE